MCGGARGARGYVFTGVKKEHIDIMDKFQLIELLERL